MNRNACVICGEKTNVSGGWHLSDGIGGIINLCSNACVAKYIEQTEKFINRIQKLKKRKVTPNATK